MTIDASLFAHIHNDAFLAGTYKLQGQRFSKTVEYLSTYLNKIHEQGEIIPPKYAQLMKELQYLQQVENSLETCKLDEEVTPIAKRIVHALSSKLTGNKSILIPGGWSTQSGGHAMVYQFTKSLEGYRFTVFNSGGGLEHHAKKSIRKKELYNPKRVWSIPLPKNDKEKEELDHFIERLLQAKIAPSYSNIKKEVDETVLYEEILPSISYLGATEIDPSEDMPEHAYTGGQLSGTCAQRSLHQMLKINSDNLESYQQFIFNFKMHSLREYTQLCFEGKQPFNHAVAEQIYLAIDNSFKILNAPPLFPEKIQKQYVSELKQLKKEVSERASHLKKQTQTDVFKPYPIPSIGDSLIKAPMIILKDSTLSSKKPALIDSCDQLSLLDRLDKTIADIRKLDDPAVKYAYLEKLILSLPLNQGTDLVDPAYKSIQTVEQCQAFLRHMNNIQELLTNVKQNLLKNGQSPLFNQLSLSVLSLQVDGYEQYLSASRAAAPQKDVPGVPSFRKFTDMMMATLVGNHDRDPFIATNNPQADQRILLLRQRFQHPIIYGDDTLFAYFKGILESEPTLNLELTNLYTAKFGNESSEMYKEIKKNHIEAFYMITLHLRNVNILNPKFAPLINKIKVQWEHESALRKAINPFFSNSLSAHEPMSIASLHNKWRIISPLYSAFVPFQELSTVIKENKYNLKKSPALEALESDIANLFPIQHSNYIHAPQANVVQLKKTKGQQAKKGQEPQKVTEQDIIARNYYHLRAVPTLQIALTLDYFTQNMALLTDDNDKRYLEANIFQPGLLISALNSEEFMPQFDNFLNVGKRFFAQHGKHTKDSMLFFRLDFLVSSYFAKLNPNEGLARLKSVQENLLIQLSLTTDDDVTYILQQYIFLATVARIEAGEGSRQLLLQAMQSYFYINSHTNPNILEDNAHRIEVEAVIAKFKIFASQQPISRLRDVVKTTLQDSGISLSEDLKGTYPVYTVINDKRQTLVVDALQGKIFERNLAKAGVPLVIQNHPLMKQLGLQDERLCLINPAGTYMVFKRPGGNIHLFYNNDELIVQKEWTINGNTDLYELKALSNNHQAFHANNKLGLMHNTLPDVLTDGTMNYWKSVNSDQKEGILVKDNIPTYFVQNEQISPLNKQGFATPYQLCALNVYELQLFNVFETNRFIVAHEDNQSKFVTLPRFGLNFKIDKRTNIVINEATEEQVISAPSPIHPAVTGLILEGKGQQRFVLPVVRLYGTEVGALESDFYPVVHDRENYIAANSLQELWAANPPEQIPQWSYTDSESYTSFQLIDGEPIADTPADALYLAYMYLVTNQPEKAWNILEDCNKRLGGLKGEPAELQYIKWICKDLPYKTDKNVAEPKDPAKDTPPFVACQLKAMSLLSDYLTQDRQFDLTAPDSSNKTANEAYAKLQYEESKGFLTSLPETIYHTFSRFQRMERHLAHTYQLSKIERKRLLDYYHQSQPENAAPLGALGFEWMRLSLESLLEEQQTLQAQKMTGNLSAANERRKAHIEKQIKKLKSVVSKSTVLELIPIDLSLPFEFNVNRNVLKTIQAESVHGKLVDKNFDKSSKALQSAIGKLSSTIEDDDFINNFSSYLHIACSDNEDLRKPLLDYCTRTLFAKRHLPLNKHDSHIPFLCNVLYRALTNKGLMSSAKYETFEELLRQVRNYVVPELKVYQAKDVYREILATPQQLIDEYQHKEHKPVKVLSLPKTPLIEQTGLNVDLSGFPLCDELIRSYQEIQSQLSIGLAELSNRPAQGLDEEYSIEEEAGKLLISAEQEKKKLAERLVNNAPLTQVLERASSKALIKLKATSEEFWNKALALANQGPSDLKMAQIWALEKEAKSRKELTRADLLSFYTRADFTYTIEKTGLSSEDVQTLHDTIHSALVSGIQYQSVEKITNKLIEATSGEKDLSSAVLALDLLSRPEIPALDSPAIVLLQHEEQILLHDRQVSALKELLASPESGEGFNEVVEKIIMGGGKSKVILPILAEMKAQGGNLVIVEVPQALLETNYEDLNRTSQRLYGKRAYRFDFNRDSNASPERLEQVYKMFVEVMTNKSYLVTTGEAMMSLELKYIELLFTTGKTDKAWEQQIYWLDKITGLLRHHGDCIIDEVHLGLLIKKRLNYTGTDAKPIGTETIKYAIALYKAIDPKILKEAPGYRQDHDWTDFKTQLACKLINDNMNPLGQFAQRAIFKYGKGVTNELVEYLTNEAKKNCDAVINASSEDKEMLAFFKQEISTILPQTLGQKVDGDYGPSQRKDLSPIEKTIALPYAANNIVNERNRFGNQLEAINKTAQMMLIKGISKKLLIQRIEQWNVSARKELFQNPELKHLDQTPTAKGFEILAQKLGIKLSQIDLNDLVQLDKLHAHFQYNQALIFDVLQEQSLGKIQQEGELISSNSFNHVDLYRSVQAVSGTPSNHTTFHQRLKYNKSSSLGTDGYIIEVIHKKNTRISGFAYENATKYVKTILTHSQEPERTRAIIDICAKFQGVSNLAVAQEIASFYRDKTPNVIKHVLYFNKNQVLCAIDVNKPNKPIVLKTTEEKEISRLLGSTPDQRFTYYDEAHTVGTDITQATKAHALVLADEKTSLQDFLQGSMRMRGLGLEQTMEIIVSENLKKMKRPELIKLFAKADNLTLLQDNLTAAKLQMANLVRSKCLTSIRNLPSEDAHKKRELAKIFKSKSFLIDKPTVSFYELYGALNKSQKAADILKNYKEKLIACWEACCDEAIKIGINDDKRIGSELQTIIDKALPNCLEEYEAAENELGREVEIQAEMQRETQLELAAIQDVFDPTLEPMYYLEWGKIKTFYSDSSALKARSFAMNVVCSTPEKPFTMFSKELRVSKNYALTYQGQEKILGAFLKPTYLVWYHMHEGVLQAMIVTPQEADVIALKIGIMGIKDSWLSTTLDTVVGGKRPNDILQNPHYQSMREQVRFFNGELSGLLTQETPLSWLKENTVEKLEFFERELMAYRPGSITEFPRLKIALTQTSVEGFAYIAQHPFDDLSSFDWKRIDSRVMQIQAAEYTRVAQTFAYMNQHWQQDDLSIESLQAQFNLPLNSLDYVNAHLKHVKLLAQIVDRLSQSFASSTNESFVLSLSPDEIQLCNKILGESLDDFVGNYQLSLSTRPSNPIKNLVIREQWSKVDFDALRRFRTHPLLIDNNLTDAFIYPIVAQKATSAAQLQSLLEEKFSSIALTNQILANEYCDESVVVALLDSKSLMDDESWRLLLHKKRNRDEFLFLVAKMLDSSKAPIPGFVIDYILEQGLLSEEQLIKIAKTVVNEAFFYKIFIHPLATATVRRHLFENPKFPAERFLADFLINNPNDIEGLKLITNNYLFSAEVLEKNLVHIKSSEMLLSFISLPQVNHQVLLNAISHSALSGEVAKRIIGVLGKDTSLMTALLQSALNKYYIARSDSEIHKWQEVVLLISDEFKRNGTINILIDKLKHERLSKSLQFQLLSLLGKDIVSVLSLRPLFNEANETTLHVFVDESKTGILDEDLLIILAKKCKRGESLDKFLERSDLTDKVIFTLLNNAEFTEQQLLKVLKYPLSKETSQYIYGHKAAGELVRTALINILTPEYLLSYLRKNPGLSNQELLEIIKQPAAISTKVLEVILQKFPLDSAVELEISAHPEANETVRRTLINRPNFSPEIAQNILRNVSGDGLKALGQRLFVEWESKPDNILVWEDLIAQTMQNLSPDTADKLIKAHPLNARLGHKVLNIFGATMLNRVPFTKMVSECTETELEKLITLNGVYSEKDMQKLVHRANSSTQIDYLLERDEMTSQMAEHLLTKPNFSGKIDNWDWLTEKQLLRIINMTDDYDSLVLALTHKNLSESARKNCFAEMERQQAAKIALAGDDPKEQILAALESLKILSCRHVITGLKNPKYSLASETAFNLYQKLHKDTHNCFKAKHPNIKRYKEECQVEIDKASGVLGEHRGYKQVLVDIINVILAIPTLILTRKGHDWRLFKVDTNSMKTTKKATEKIRKLDDETPPEEGIKPRGR